MKQVLPIAMLAAAFLAGCASVPKDLGRSSVDEMVRERWPTEGQGEFEDFLVATDEALTVDEAVRLALNSNAELVAAYAQLKLGAAGVYEATHIANPVVGFASLAPQDDDEKSLVTTDISVALMGLLQLPARRKQAGETFDALQKETAAKVLSTIADVKRAYYEYVGAKELLNIMRRAERVAALSGELMERYRQAGNVSDRELAEARAEAAEAKLATLDALSRVVEGRINLATLMGVSTRQDWEVPGRLPPVPNEEFSAAFHIDRAKAMRLDIDAAADRVKTAADRLGLVNWTNWSQGIDIGYELERETDGAELRGPGLEWEVPLFGGKGGGNRAAKLEAAADLELALADLRRLELETENEVTRLAHTLNNLRRRSATQRNALLPAHEDIVAFADKEQNYMLIGPFELLHLKQQQLLAQAEHAHTVQEYWIARAELSALTGGKAGGKAGGEAGGEAGEAGVEAGGETDGMPGKVPRERAGEMPAENPREKSQENHHDH